MCKPSSTTLHDYQEISFVTLKIPPAVPPAMAAACYCVVGVHMFLCISCHYSSRAVANYISSE